MIFNFLLLLQSRRSVDVYEPRAKRLAKSESEAINGLSYNPEESAHHDQLGQATAFEMKLAAKVISMEG